MTRSMMPGSWSNWIIISCKRNRHIQIILTDMEANYYTTYLQAYLTDVNDPRKDDEEFIESRADAASEEYEVQCRGGAPPPCAQELAMAVLMEGFE